MKRLLTIFFLFSLAQAQTVDTLKSAGTSTKGKFLFYNHYTLPNTANQYFNGYGAFVNLRDTTRSYFSATSPIFYSAGVISSQAMDATHAGYVVAGGSSAKVLHGDGTWKDTAAAGSSITPSALTKTDDANVTLTLGGTPSTALLQATSLTLGWTGSLAATRGGTGTATVTTGDLLYGSGTNAWSKLAIGANGQHLEIVGGLPVWRDTTAVGGSSGWSLTGNAGNNPITARFGTTDAQKIYGITNGAIRFIVDSVTNKVFLDSIPFGHGGYESPLGARRNNNMAVGDSAGFKLLPNGSIGQFNTYFGILSGARDSVGINNTAFGYNTLSKNKGALAINNVAFGSTALGNNTTGGDNTAVGTNALGSNTTASSSTAVGSQALAAQNGAGGANSALGNLALTANTSGQRNTAVGYNSLHSNNTAGFQTAVGWNALGAATGSAERNTGIGNESLESVTSGVENTALGDGAGYQITQGRTNITIGVNETGSLGITTGSYNTIMGGNIVSPSSSLSNYGIFGDGQGNQRILWNTTGQLGIGTRWPSATLTTGYNRAAQFGATFKLPYSYITTTNATQSSSTVTLTFAAQTVQPFGIGDTIVVAGVTPAGYNGTFRVTGASTTTVTYTTTAGLTNQTVAGTILGGTGLLTVLENGAVERDSVNAYFSSGTNANLKRTYLERALMNTATLDFPSVASLGVQSLTITVTGAVDGDATNIGVPNGSMTAGLVFTSWVSAANTVTIQCYNSTLGAIDPASGTFRAVATKY